MSARTETLYRHVREVSSRSPGDRSITDSFVLFVPRAICLVLLGGSFALIALLLTAFTSGNPYGVFALSVVTCGALTGIAFLAIKRWMLRQLRSVIDVKGLNASEYPEAEARSTISNAQTTLSSLARLEDSLKTSSKSLDELQGRVEFLQNYVDELHEEERMRTHESGEEVGQAIKDVRAKIDALTDAFEKMLLESVDQPDSLPPRYPR